MISVLRVFHTVCILCPELSSSALLRVGKWGGLSYHGYLICISRLTSAQNWCCLFLQGVFPTTWPLVRILRTLLRSRGFPSDSYFVRRFYRRLQSSLWSYCPFPREMLIFFLPILLVVITLVDRFLKYDRSSGRILVVFSSLIPCFLKGLSEVLVRTEPRMQ